MGLDMYLRKAKRVNSLEAEQYEELNEAIPWGEEVSEENKPDLVVIDETKDLPGAKELNDSLHIEGEAFPYWSIFTEIGYWRKDNHIHNWFVKNVQNGVDECQLSEVSEAQLTDLLNLCKAVIKNHSEAEELLPTTQGFFFGSDEYDEGYYASLSHTVEILEKALKETDFEKEIIFYRASW